MKNIKESNVSPEEVQKFIDGMNDGAAYEPYNYQKYLTINPKLSERMYRYLWENRWLWKVACGKKVEVNGWSEVLGPVWYLDMPENYKKRHIHGYPELEKAHEDFVKSQNPNDATA